MACADEVEQVFEAHPGKVAALVIEPLVQGADGMIVQPPGYLRRMREICDRHGALLVCDEVATGFGRTGTMFAVEQEGVRPDILTVAKGLTGGYLPLAATLTTEEIFDSFLGPFESRRTFFHGHTYTGNPLACAAATASMRLFRDRDVLAGLPAREEALARGARAARRPTRTSARSAAAGSWWASSWCATGPRRRSTPSSCARGHQVTLEARGRGAILRPLGNVVVLMPPLAMTEPQLAELGRITRESIEAVVARI